MTFIDMLTGWPEAICTKDCSATTAASVFLRHIVCRYGKVKQLHSDRGSSYTGKMIREITARLMTKQTLTSSRNPTSNGRAERLHKTIEDIIACYITDDHENWPDLVPIALWNVRSNISSRTGFSPYTLMYGRDPPAMGYPEERPIPETGTDMDWFLRTKHSIEILDGMAKTTTEKYEEGIRKRMDEGIRPVNLTEGEWVYIHDPFCRANNTSKFSPRYRGTLQDNRSKGK